MAGVTLRLQVDGADAAETDALGRQLLQEIQDLPIDDARPATDGEAPEGSKAFGALALGGVLVDLAPTVVPQVVEFVKAWFARGDGRKIHLRAKVGDGEVDVEWTQGASEAEITAMALKLTKALGEANQGPH